MTNILFSSSLTNILKKSSFVQSLLSSFVQSLLSSFVQSLSSFEQSPTGYFTFLAQFLTGAPAP